MNKKVDVTGMQVKTKVGSNLLICTTNEDKDYSSATLQQSRKALLEPVSSVNGSTGSFYYTTNAKANGDAVVDVYQEYSEDTANADAKAGKDAYSTAFQTAYNTPSSSTVQSGDFEIGYGYVDYMFYIKATSDAASQKVVMSKCDLDYAADALHSSGTLGKENGPDLAWRVGVFATSENVPAGTGILKSEHRGGTSIATAANQKGLLSLAAAANQTANTAVNSTSSATGAVVNNAETDGVVIGTIAQPNTTVYYKVIVRLWLEGEDKSCTSETYANLTNEYTLDLRFEMVDGNDSTTAVKNITTNEFVASSGTVQSGAQYDHN